MSQVSCPRCGLRLQSPRYEPRDACPRCLGRLGFEVPLVEDERGTIAARAILAAAGAEPAAVKTA